MSETITVNFSDPMPVFPLPDTVLLPHAVLPLHIFEPRYRQMVCHCLDRTGQIAMATFESVRDGLESPAIRKVVCIGQIIQHDALPDGRYNILMHGVCRATIREMFEPCGDCAYRTAKLAPVEPVEQPPVPMPEVRAELRTMLMGPRLQRLRGVETLMDWIDREDVPTHALLELIGFAVVRDTEIKYRLLAEADPTRRANLIQHELTVLDRLVGMADTQSYREWPKGTSWN